MESGTNGSGNDGHGVHRIFYVPRGGQFSPVGWGSNGSWGICWSASDQTEDGGKAQNRLGMVEGKTMAFTITILVLCFFFGMCFGFAIASFLAATNGDDHD
jgi:hypothetical protein